MQPNFFVVFPEGVLESAPQFFAVVARADRLGVDMPIARAVVGLLSGFLRADAVVATLMAREPVPEQI